MESPTFTSPGIQSLNVPSLGGWNDLEDKVESKDCFPVVGSEHLARTSYRH